MRILSLQEMALAVRQRIDIDGQENAYGGNSEGYITDTRINRLFKCVHFWIMGFTDVEIRPKLLFQSLHA